MQPLILKRTWPRFIGNKRGARPNFCLPDHAGRGIGVPTMREYAVHKIAVGSTNPVKLAAVRNVTQRIWPHAAVMGVAAASGVRSQPLSDDEAIAGAINRKRAARDAGEADLGFGLEGYVAESQHGMFVSAWVAAVGLAADGVTDPVGLGASGRFRLPEWLAQQVRSGAELGPLMDRTFHGENTKQKQGAVGIFTNGLMERTEALQVGVTFALTRFINFKLYEQ
ncbi:MAG: inosine/xanthosine triphosphatase [Caldilineaceae bacterium]